MLSVVVDLMQLVDLWIAGEIVHYHQRFYSFDVDEVSCKLFQKVFLNWSKGNKFLAGYVLFSHIPWAF